MSEQRLDGKYFANTSIRKVVDGTAIPDDEYIIFRPADNALLPALGTYRAYCEHLGCSQKHLNSVIDLIDRVEKWRAAHPDRCKVPD